MKISFLGGAAEVGASCIHIKISNKNILFDSGVRQNAGKDPLPDFRKIQELGGIDAIIISHAHLDHIGSLSIISKEYPNAKIYMNMMTKDLVRVLLYDSLKIMNNREQEVPLYADIDVENMLNRIVAMNYGVEFKILDDISITFYNAGHIAGAACVYLKTNEGAVFYSGDFSLFSQNTVEGAKVPKLRPDVGIFEATYGDKLHSNRQIEEDKLIDVANECINNGGKMLIPAFALGRAQEVILILKKAINKNKLKETKIYVDGLVRNINRVYKINPTYLRNTLAKKILRGAEPFYDDNIIEVPKLQNREEIVSSKDSCIIISSSGMITGGPSQVYAELMASNENNYIVITGYQDEEAPGRKLLNLLEENPEERTIKINDRNIPVKCHIEKIGLSAHGDKSEIKAIVDLLSPKHTFLVHGEESIIKGLAGEMIRESRGRVYIPKSGQDFEVQLDNPRKQISKQLEMLMGEVEELDEQNIKRLWEFVDKNYGAKTFYLEELIYIWKGIGFDVKDEEYLRKVQNIVLNSLYFETDAKRLFLFKAKSENDVQEALKPKEIKQNEIKEIAEELFKDYNYKKIGVKESEREAVLYFDFPKALDNSIEYYLNEFKNRTKWSISINDNANNNVAEMLIKKLLKNVEIKKISFYIAENKFIVNLLDDFKDTGEIQEFRKVTGMELEINSASSLSNGTGDSKQIDLIKSNSKNIMEQNQAFSLIDEAFREKEHKPYKKSIKVLGSERYIEFSFISPNIGNKYVQLIEELSSLTGWAMKIASGANQNEILKIAMQLCYENDIELKKNPSFNPIDFSVGLKTDKVIEEDIFEKISSEFKKITGCDIK